MGLVTDHHRDGADEQEKIAQRYRSRGAERRLELGGVGGEARDDLAGLLRVEEARVEPRQMGEEIGAQVGDDPLADRHDEVVARAGGESEHGDDADHRRGNRARMKPALEAEKPKSTMRRTAIGTTSVAAEATMSATSAAAIRAAIDNGVGQERPQGAERDAARASLPRRWRRTFSGEAPSAG